MGRRLDLRTNPTQLTTVRDDDNRTPMGGSEGRLIKSATHRLGFHDLISIANKKVDTNKEYQMVDHSSKSSIKNVSSVGRSIKTGIQNQRPFDFDEFDDLDDIDQLFDLDFNSNTGKQEVDQNRSRESSSPIGGSVGRPIKTATRRLRSCPESSIPIGGSVGRPIKTATRRLRSCPESSIPIGGSVGTSTKPEIQRKRPHDSNANTEKMVEQSPSNETSTPIGRWVGTRNIKTATRKLRSCPESSIPIGRSVGTSTKAEIQRKRPHDSNANTEKMVDQSRSNESSTPIGGSVGRNIKTATRRLKSYDSKWIYYGGSNWMYYDGSDWMYYDGSDWMYYDGSDWMYYDGYNWIYEDDLSVSTEDQMVDRRRSRSRSPTRTGIRCRSRSPIRSRGESISSEAPMPTVGSIGTNIEEGIRRSHDFNSIIDEDFNTLIDEPMVDRTRSRSPVRSESPRKSKSPVRRRTRRESLIPIGGSVDENIPAEPEEEIPFNFKGIDIHDINFDVDKQTLDQLRELWTPTGGSQCTNMNVDQNPCRSSNPIGGSEGRHIQTASRRLSPHDLSIVDKEIDTNKEDLMDNQSSDSSIQNVSPVGRSIKTGIQNQRPFDFDEFDDLDQFYDLDFNSNTGKQKVDQIRSRESSSPIGGSEGTTIKTATRRLSPHDLSIVDKEIDTNKEDLMDNQISDSSIQIVSSVGRSIKTGIRRLRPFDFNDFDDLDDLDDIDQLFDLDFNSNTGKQEVDQIRSRESSSPIGGSEGTTIKTATRRLSPHDLSIVDKEIDTNKEDLMDNQSSESSIQNVSPVGRSIKTGIRRLRPFDFNEFNDRDFNTNTCEQTVYQSPCRESLIPIGGSVGTTIRAEPNPSDSVYGAARLIPYSRRNEQVSKTKKRRNDRSLDKIISKRQRLSDDWPPILRPFNLREWIAHNFPNRIIGPNEMVDIYNRIAPYTGVSADEVTLTCYVMNEDFKRRQNLLRIRSKPAIDRSMDRTNHPMKFGIEEIRQVSWTRKRLFNLRELIAHNFPNRIIGPNEMVDIYNRIAPYAGVSANDVTLTCYVMNEDFKRRQNQLRIRSKPAIDRSMDQTNRLMKFGIKEIRQSTHTATEIRDVESISNRWPLDGRAILGSIKTKVASFAAKFFRIFSII